LTAPFCPWFFLCFASGFPVFLLPLFFCASLFFPLSVPRPKPRTHCENGFLLFGSSVTHESAGFRRNAVKGREALLSRPRDMLEGCAGGVKAYLAAEMRPLPSPWLVFLIADYGAARLGYEHSSCDRRCKKGEGDAAGRGARGDFWGCECRARDSSSSGEAGKRSGVGRAGRMPVNRRLDGMRVLA